MSSVYRSTAGSPPDWLDAIRDNAKGGSAAVEPELGAPVTPIGRAEELGLSPGMPVNVYISTGERTPLSYLVKPLDRLKGLRVDKSAFVNSWGIR